MVLQHQADAQQEAVEEVEVVDAEEDAVHVEIKKVKYEFLPQTLIILYGKIENLIKWHLTGNQKEWVPVTKLGRLVRDGKIRSLEEIYLYSLPIKEFEVIDFFLGRALKDEVLKIMPVQKQTRAGQRTRFKAFVAIGDSNGHIGLGVKCSKEVATAIRGAIILAKLSVVPVRRGYWGNKIGKPHTVPCKVCHISFIYLLFIKNLKSS